MIVEAAKLCNSCGASAIDEKGKCLKCGALSPLKAFGYEITKLTNGCYILTDKDTNKLLTFDRLSLAASERVEKLTKVPYEVVAATFAVLEAKKAKEEEEAKRKKQKNTGKEEKNDNTSKFDVDTEAKINESLKVVLEAENQLEALTPHLNSMAAGEENTKKTGCVLLLSSKCKPDMKQILLFKATEGAGKSTIMKTISKGYKLKDVGRFSAHALDYSDLEDFEVLNLKELGNMDNEDNGVSTLKFLSSEDNGYNVEVVVKDEETGKFRTEVHTIPPITTVSSTTRLLLDPQFERRAWIYPADESQEQTQRISEFKAKIERQEAEKLLGLRKLTDKEFSSEVYSRFIKQFQPINVIVPFPQTILDTLSYDALRVRGDLDKLLVFAKLYANLNRKRLKKIDSTVYSKVTTEAYALSPEVAIEALALALQPISRMLTKIDERTKVLFSALKEVKITYFTYSVAEHEKDNKISHEQTFEKKGAKINKAVRDKLAVHINRSERVVRNFLSQLASAGYVSEASAGKNQPKTYTLLYDVEEIEKKKLGILDKIKNSSDLKVKMQKEAQEWFDSLLENISQVEGKEKDNTITEDTLSDISFSSTTEENLSNSLLTTSQDALAETTSNNRQNKELPTHQDDLSIKQKEGCFAKCKHYDKPTCKRSHDFNYTTPIPIDCTNFEPKEKETSP